MRELASKEVNEVSGGCLIIDSIWCCSAGAAGIVLSGAFVGASRLPPLSLYPNATANFDTDFETSPETISSTNHDSPIAIPSVTVAA